MKFNNYDIKIENNGTDNYNSKIRKYNNCNIKIENDNYNPKKFISDIVILTNAIDSRDIKKIENLYSFSLSTDNENNKKNNKKDIIFEMYNKNELNSERFQFIVENCTAYLNISSSLIKKLMKDNNKELLEILFKYHIKFFDTDLIVIFLISHKNRIPLSNSKLKHLINNNKYKL